MGKQGCTHDHRNHNCGKEANMNLIKYERRNKRRKDMIIANKGSKNMMVKNMTMEKCPNHNCKNSENRYAKGIGKA